MSKALAVKDAGQHYAAAPLGERQKYALALATAQQLLPQSLRGSDSSETAARFMLLAETGAMLGVHPLAAIQGIHIIEGKPTVSPGLMSGIVRAAGHKIRVTVSGAGEALQAKAVLVRADDPDFPFEATWTIDRARRANLLGKKVWQQYPEAMLKARAIAEVCREGAEDVLMGVRYTPDELDVPVDEQGEMLEGEVEETTSSSEPVDAVDVEPELAWDEARIRSFKDEIGKTVDMDSLTAMYMEAREASMLNAKVDRLGTTLEFLLQERRGMIQRGEVRAPAPAASAPEPEAPAEETEPEPPVDEPMALGGLEPEGRS